MIRWIRVIECPSLHEFLRRIAEGLFAVGRGGGVFGPRGQFAEHTQHVMRKILSRGACRRLEPVDDCRRRQRVNDLRHEATLRRCVASRLDNRAQRGGFERRKDGPQAIAEERARCLVGVGNLFGHIQQNKRHAFRVAVAGNAAFDRVGHVGRRRRCGVMGAVVIIIDS